jgi:ribose 5-phosphate isomerase B
MRVAVCADEAVGIAPLLLVELGRRGFEATPHGVLAEDEQSGWAWASEAVARDVLALSLRATSEAQLSEILDAWFAGEPSEEAEDRANVGHLGEIERG